MLFIEEFPELDESPEMFIFEYLGLCQLTNESCTQLVPEELYA